MLARKLRFMKKKEQIKANGLEKNTHHIGLREEYRGYTSVVLSSMATVAKGTSYVNETLKLKSKSLLEVHYSPQSDEALRRPRASSASFSRA